MRRSLADLQARMRARQAQSKTPLFVNITCLGCGGSVLKGKDYCSRCKRNPDKLRDALPGIVSTDIVLGHGQMSRKQVADMLGISSSALCVWEKQGKTPRPFKIERTNRVFYTSDQVLKIREYIEGDLATPIELIKGGMAVGVPTLIPEATPIPEGKYSIDQAIKTLRKFPKAKGAERAVNRQLSRFTGKKLL